jgi:histidyl-tRNA synthetase
MKKTKKRPSYLIDNITGQLEIARTYGYTPIDTPTFVDVKGKNHTEDMSSAVSFINFYFQNELDKKETQPFQFAYELPYKKSGKRKSPKNIEMELHTIGSLQSITDAAAIKAAVAILEDQGYKNLIVEINSVGDKDSYIKLEKELIAYYRKNINSLPANLRQSFKKDIWSILSSTDSKAEEFLANAPKPMNVLSDTSRKHFKQVLEFLEVIDIPYCLNPSLIGQKGLNVHTIFEIKTQGKNKKGTTLGRGYRYNHISREINLRRETPGLKIELSFPRKKKVTNITLSKKKRPKFFFVQLGFEAKLRSLNVIDMLINKKIAIDHSLPSDKITEQMNLAERMHASHIIIIGQREALEGNVVVRDMNNRSQKNIPLNTLVDHLRKLSK